VRGGAEICGPLGNRIDGDYFRGLLEKRALKTASKRLDIIPRGATARSTRDGAINISTTGTIIHSHDQSITPVNFRITKTGIVTVKKAQPQAPDLSEVLIMLPLSEQ